MGSIPVGSATGAMFINVAPIFYKDLTKMKKTYKIIIYVAIAVFIIGLLGVLPFIISWIYSQEAPSDFFVTRFDASDFLVYYASALSFLGTLILGVLTLFQNKRSQEKTDTCRRGVDALFR